MRTAAAALCLVLALAACRQTPRMEESPGPEPDAFFALALEPGPVPVPADDLRPPLADAKAVELRFRFLTGEVLLNAPVLTVLTGERAEIRLANRVSYVSDFDVEVAETAFIADPVISILDGGLTLRTVAVPAEGGRSVSLAWRIRLSRHRTPIRAKALAIGGTEPVVIQFPEVHRREASGRTLLDLGVETALVRISGEEPLTVLVSAVPVEAPDQAGPGDTLELLPEAERPSGPAEPEPDALLDGAAEREAPPRGRRVAVAIGVLKGPAPVRPLHLDAVAGALFLSLVDVLRQTSAATAAEPGAGVSWLLDTNYHRDSKPCEIGARDPQVATASHGFEGWFDVRDGEPLLDFRFSVLREMRELPQTGDGVEFPVERPWTVERRGVLRLRGAVDVMPIGALADGRNVVLVVRRDVPR